MFKKLRIKYVTTIMLLLISIVTIVCITIFYSSKNNNESMLFNQMNITLDNLTKPTFDSDVDISKTIEGLLISIGESGNIIKYSTNYDLSLDDVNNIIDSTMEVKFKDKDRGFIEYNDSRYAYTIKRDRKGENLFYTNSKLYDDANTKLLISFSMIGIGTTIALFFVSVYIAKSAIKPVEAAYNNQMRFIADASHELKTPLAIIKTNLEVLNNNKGDTINNQLKWFDYISFQTDRMSKLVQDLLYLAKSDKKELIGNIKKYNLSDDIMNQILSFEAIMFEKDITLECNIDENIMFSGDEEAINQLIGILLDNAIKYSYKKNSIEVSLTKVKQKIILSVQNTGDTINSEELTKIFERFYRVDKSRSRETGSYGLGLSIAKAIVEKHNGNIRAESNNNKTRFIVEL